MLNRIYTNTKNEVISYHNVSILLYENYQKPSFIFISTFVFASYSDLDMSIESQTSLIFIGTFKP